MLPVDTIQDAFLLVNTYLTPMQLSVWEVSPQMFRKRFCIHDLMVGLSLTTGATMLSKNVIVSESVT
jgi:hypothetical protein